MGIKSGSSVKAKKHLGQNFLKDSYYLQKIIESIPTSLLSSGCRLVEIGAGLGDLTSRLLDCGALLAFEVDQDLKPYLLHKFADSLRGNRLEFVFGDIMEIWKDRESLCACPYVLVANLPYYIATAIVLKALRDIQCEALVVMTQKEVAEKFCGIGGASALSVLARSVGEVQMVSDVPPQAFEPSPKVVSSVFSITRIHKMDLDVLESFLKTAFRAPRKKLCASLASKYDSKEVLDAFEELGLSEKVRAHQLTTSHYHQLVRILEKR